MALGIIRETAPGHLVKLGCGLFGESFWELGRKCQIRAQLVNLLKMRSFLGETERGRGEGQGRGEGGGVSFTYFTFSSDLDTGFYFLSQ